MTRRVQGSYKYRWYPTDEQADELVRTFGCVRLVYNKALEARAAVWHTEQRRVGYTGTSALLTGWKRTDELAFLNDVRGMTANHALARAISDAAWSELRRQLEYKCAWYGRDLVVVDRWLPSSKTCSACGRLAEAMPLEVRAWACEACGARHDRDVNAATNILAAGLAVAACGAGVRPQREPSRMGRPATKQETQRTTAGNPPH